MPCDILAPPIEVLLVDDQRAILAGVTALIESEGPFMRVTGQARTCLEALELARRLQPTVIVLDADLGGEDGLALIPQTLRECCARVVVLTCNAEPETRTRALGLGACDLISKAASGSELIMAIQRATSFSDKGANI